MLIKKENCKKIMWLDNMKLKKQFLLVPNILYVLVFAMFLYEIQNITLLDLDRLNYEAE